MFWVNSGTKVEIKRAYMSGSSVTTVVDSGLNTPVAIVIDPETSELFWIDSGLDQVT